MMLFEFDAVTWNGDVYCIGCLPKNVDIDDESVTPIYAQDEVDEIQVCCECGCEHDYMSVRIRDEGDILDQLEQENLPIQEDDSNG